jgi:ComF family protein
VSRTFLNLVFPIFCRECGLRLMTQENAFFCPTCWESVPRIEPPVCLQCGRPLPRAVGFGPSEDRQCAPCREAETPPYRRIYAAAVYQGSIATAVKLLKFNDRRLAARPLGELLRTYTAANMIVDPYTDIVPVPLHKVRLRERGFNQAELLAREITDEFPHASLNLNLHRIRPTRIQSRLRNSKERISNVAGAFAVPREVDFQGRTVLLVDDVVTTGGTVAECARALKRAGADAVDVLAAALPVDDADFAV